MHALISAQRPYPIPTWAQRGRLRWTWVVAEGLTFFKRGGANVETYTWMDVWEAHCHEEATVARLAEAGFNCLTTHFFSGFGLIAEAPEIERARALARCCHDYGLRVLAYITLAALCPETFRHEVPQMDDWLARDPGGRPLWAGPRHYWRVRPSLAHPDYRAYLGRVIEAALAEGDFDGVWFEGCEPVISYCATYRRRWQEFIASHTDFYQRKCHYPDIKFLEPPPVCVPGDPLWMDWETFCQQLFIETLRELHGQVKAYGSDKLLVASGALQEHLPWEEYAAYLDAVYLPNPWAPGVRNQHISNQSALYLLADAAGLTAIGSGYRLREDTYFHDLPSVEEGLLHVAEGLFFGGQASSAHWAMLPQGADRVRPLDLVFECEPWSCAFERPDRFEMLQTFHAFCERTARLHHPYRSAATIAILHSRESLLFDRETTLLNLRAAQLACLKNHLPCDILPSRELSRLEEYDVLIVPEQPCVSKEAMAQVVEFVRAGGGLILFGQAAARARRGRFRPVGWLRQALGLGEEPAPLPNAQVVAVGAGRVLSLPVLAVEPAEYAPHDPDPSGQWDWLADAVRDISAQPVPVTLEGPPTLLCRPYYLADGTLVVHLLNYDVEHPVGNARLIVRFDVAADREAVCYRPEDENFGTPLDWLAAPGGFALPLPPIIVYAVVELSSGQPSPRAREEEAERPEPLRAPFVPEQVWEETIA